MILQVNYVDPVILHTWVCSACGVRKSFNEFWMLIIDADDSDRSLCRRCHSKEAA